MKGDKDMIRIVSIAGALLAMFAIIGISIHSINNINRINQKSRDKEEGEVFASMIAQTTATTSVWDYLRGKETSTETTGTGENAESGVVDGEGEQEAPVSETEAAPEQTVPVSTGFTVHMD